MGFTGHRMLLTGVLLLTTCGCQKEEIGIGGVTYTLKGAAQSRPVDVSNVEIVGYCTADEIKQIAKCLGRIPAPKLPVKRIMVEWPEERLAARVLVSDDSFGATVIFLAKDKAGEWHLRGAASVFR